MLYCRSPLFIKRVTIIFFCMNYCDTQVSKGKSCKETNLFLYPVAKLSYNLYNVCRGKLQFQRDSFL